MFVKRLYIIGLMMLFLVSPNFSFATHIVGGEINYRCLGNNNYEITLRVFRDCDTGVPWFDNPASVGVFDSNNNLVYDLRLFFRENDTLNLYLNDPCLVAPPNVCIHTTSYVDTVSLPFRPGGYQLVYQRCCRNVDIVNIVNPLNAGATYSCLVTEEALLSCNSSAVFNSWPPVYICLNRPINFDHSAIDIDGDSLVYEMCTPLDGATPMNPMPQPPFNPPYQNVTWLPPFSQTNMLGGVDSLRINSVTGLLQGTPTILGVFVVGICVSEYRNGQLISTSRRDFQYATGICGTLVSSSFFAPVIQCENSLSVQFQNNSNSLGTGYIWNFGDTTTNASSILENPVYIYPDTGTYTIQLITDPNSLCADTSYQTINLQLQTINIDFDLSVVNCQDSIILQAQDLSTDSLSSIVQWQWNFGNGQISNSQSANVNYNQSGTYPISLIVQAANGCRDTLLDTISLIIPSINMADTLFVCPSTNPIVLNPAANTNYSYQWSPSSGLNNSNIGSPLASPSSTTTYRVTVSAFNGIDTCYLYDETTIVVRPELLMNIQADTLYCDSIMNLSVSSNSSAQFDWYLDNSFNNSIFSGQFFNTIQQNSIQTYYLLATDQYGCTFSDSTIGQVRYTNADIDNTSIACPNQQAVVTIENNNPSDQLNYYWLPDSLIIQGQGTSEIYTQPDSSTLFSVIISNQYGCLDTLSTLVNVFYSLPFVDISADPDTVFVGSGSQLLATENQDYSYNWIQDQTLSNWSIYNPIASPLNNSVYYLTITDINGCRNSDSILIYTKTFVCEDPYIFVPNTFTPDGDGINDILFVRGNVITELYFAVYNRWGEMVFETNSQDFGWDGTFKGQKLSPDVYGYYLRYKCIGQQPNDKEQFKKGNITLIR
jgi:gliding motility-associated-like protein